MNAKSDLGMLFELAQSGDADAENELAEFFFPRALEMARQKLQISPTPMVDHEDLACSAIRSLCIRVRNGKVDFTGDQFLSGLLRKIVYNKAAMYWRRELTQKRDRNRLQHDSWSKDGDNPVNLNELLYSNPDSVVINDTTLQLDIEDEGLFGSILDLLQRDLHGLFKELFQSLDENPRKMLLLMLDSDLSNQELADELKCSVASVERYRASIRRKIGRITEGNPA